MGRPPCRFGNSNVTAARYLYCYERSCSQTRRLHHMDCRKRGVFWRALAHWTHSWKSLCILAIERYVIAGVGVGWWWFEKTTSTFYNILSWNVLTSDSVWPVLFLKQMLTVMLQNKRIGESVGYVKQILHLFLCLSVIVCLPVCLSQPFTVFLSSDRHDIYIGLSSQCLR